MSNLQIPQGGLLINGFKPQVNTAAIAGDWVSMKTAHKIWVVFHMAQGHAGQSTLALYEATTVAGASAAVITAKSHIWYNLDCDTDIFTRATDAATYELDVALKVKMVVFQFDASQLSSGFDCVKGYAGASNILNIVGCQYILDNRYKQGTPPSVIID